MNHKFWKIRNKKFESMRSYWVYVVDSFESLAFATDVKRNTYTQAYWTAKNKNIRSINPHYDAEELVVAMACENANTKTIIEDCSVIDDVFLSPLHRLYREFGIVVVGVNGGFHQFDGDYEVLEEVISDVYKFPEEKYTKWDIKISQWVNGKHWYAKVGNVDVHDNGGNMKWDTYDEAEKWAKAYIAIGK